jgi:hypothetical protein
MSLVVKAVATKAVPRAARVAGQAVGVMT